HLCRPDDQQQFLRKRRRGGGGIFLPHIVLMSIGVITDASDDNTRELIRQPRCFHLDTLCPQCFAQAIPFGGIFDHFISRRDHTIMNYRMLVVTSLSLDCPVLTSRAPTVARETHKVRTEQTVFLSTRIPIARLSQVW